MGMMGFVLGLIGCLLAYFAYYPVPYKVKQPWKLRINIMFNRIVSKTGILMEAIGYETRVNVTRAAIRKFRTASKPYALRTFTMEDTEFDGVKVRIYQPQKRPSGGAAIVYFHGGGWVFGNADSFHPLSARFAEKSGHTLVFVDYRLAPENPFPIPFEDCLNATRYFLMRAQEFGVDQSRVAVAGDSAGGTLAAAVSQVLNTDSNLPRLKAQILIYSPLQPLNTNTPSYHLHGQEWLLSKDLMVAFWLLYAQGHQKHKAAMLRNQHTSAEFKSSAFGRLTDHRNIPASSIPSSYVPTSPQDGSSDVWDELREIFMNPNFNPLIRENLQGLPQAYILTAEYDVLRDDGYFYANRLREAKVKVTHVHKDNLFHGFLALTATGMPEALETIQEIATYMKETL